MKKQKCFATDLYLRLSREDEEKTQESNSIKNQKALLLDYLKTHPELRLHKIRVDDGYSGVSFERPDFKEMMKDVRTGKVQCIVVKDLSRFGRNWLEVGEYVQHLFPFLGVRFISVNDNIDSLTGDDDISDLILPIKNLVNESYAKDISIMTRSSLETKRKNGEFVGPFTPYGYTRSKDNKNQLVIDDYAAKVVRDIFSWKIDGMSMRMIANRLNELGILAPSDYKVSTGSKFKTYYKGNVRSKWSVATVGRILRDRVYLGELIQGKRGSVNYKVKEIEWKLESSWIHSKQAHEPIISYDEFEIANRLLQFDTRCSPESQHVYAFAGLLFCGDCKQNMIRKTTGKDKKYYYYVCGTHKSDVSCCSPHSISECKLEKAILQAVQIQIAQIMELSEMLQYISELPADSVKQQRIDKEIQFQIDEIARMEARKRQLYEHFSEGIINKYDYRLLNDRYTQEIMNMERAMEEQQKEKQKLQNHPELQKWIALFEKYRNVQVLDRRLVATLIDKIYVYDDKRIEIAFRFQDEYAHTLSIVEQALRKEAM